MPLFWVFMSFSTIHIWCGFHFMSAIFFYFVCFLFWNKIMYLFIKLNVQFQINTKVLCIPWLFQDFCWAFHIWMGLILKMDCYDITTYISVLHLEMLVLNTAINCHVIWFCIILSILYKRSSMNHMVKFVGVFDHLPLHGNFCWIRLM